MTEERTPAWLVVAAVVAILAVPVIAAIAKVESFNACVAANSRAFCAQQAAR